MPRPEPGHSRAPDAQVDGLCDSLWITGMVHAALRLSAALQPAAAVGNPADSA